MKPTLLAVLLVAVACTNASEVTTTSLATTSTVSSSPTSTLPPVVECPGAGDFGEGGGIADLDGEGSDSTTIGRISWDVNDQCESFLFEFETAEGAPATAVPAVRIEHLESFQIVRIGLEVESTVITDQLVETGLVDRLYVVRALDGGLFVDLHLSAPAAARARVETSPARLTIDLRPGFVPFVGTSVIADRMVVVSPADGTETEPLVQLMGYSRSFESNVSIQATRDGAVIAEANTTGADSQVTWGEFRTELGLPPGQVSVFVGSSSAADGNLEGVTLNLTVR